MEKQTFSVVQFQLIMQQTNKIMNAYATSKDNGVIQAVKGLVETELKTRLPESLITENIIKQLLLLTDRTEAETFIHSIEQYVIPFKKVTDSSIMSLFKKEKKLKLPNLQDFNLTQTVYLSWDNQGTRQKYMIIEQNGKLQGLKGTIENKIIKGICSICNHHTDVSLFTTTVKGNTPDHFIKHSNYICTDSKQCNTHITNEQSIIEFFNYMQK